MEDLISPAVLQLYGPPLTYVALMAALWLAVTAVYLPGTGIPELSAGIALLAAIAGIALLSPSLVGIGFLLGSLICLVGLVFFRHLWPLSWVGYGLQILGGSLLFTGESRLPIWAVIAVVGLAIAYHQLILVQGLRIQNMKRKVGPDELIGALGEVVTTLDPAGTIRVGGEIWSARISAADPARNLIPSGQRVRVVNREGLELQVVPSDLPRPEDRRAA